MSFNDLPNGSINNSVIYPIKLLIRDVYPDQAQEVAEIMKGLGYDKPMNVPAQDNQYTERIFLHRLS